MKPAFLEYDTPKPASFDWRRLVCVVLLGPVIGTTIGVAQTTAAVLCWMYYGEPDFYFRGWSALHTDYLLAAVDGGIVGIPYGWILWLYEQSARRRIRLRVAIPVQVLLAFVVAGIIAIVDFQQRTIAPAFLRETIAVVLGLFVSVKSTRAR